MLAKKWLINLLLMGMAVFFAFKTYGVWRAPEPLPETVEASPPSKVRSSQFINKRRIPPQDSYQIITDRNLFSQDRTEFVAEKEIVAAKDPNQSRYAKRIALFGVLIEGDERLALINQGRVRKRGDRQDIWVKVGDTVDNLKVIGIERDRIYLKEGSNTYEITLYDRDHPQKRERETAPQSDGPTVITTKAQPSKAKARPVPKKPVPKTKERIVKNAKKTDSAN